jgi:hypothetical protein
MDALASWLRRTVRRLYGTAVLAVLAFVTVTLLRALILSVVEIAGGVGLVLHRAGGIAVAALDAIGVL